MTHRVPVSVIIAGLLLPAPGDTVTVQEANLRARPAVVLITARVDAEVTLDCGKGPVTAKPSPFVQTGTGWFVDGRGWLITNAHVVDPVHRLPPWVIHELKKKAIEQACVEPVLKARNLVRGQQPEVEERIRRAATDRALARMRIAPEPSLTALLSNGTSLPAEVKKFSPPLLLDTSNRPLPDAGRDLALLRVPDGTYPALTISGREAQVGDPIRILGFPNVVLSHELLSQNVTPEATVTNGAVSGLQFKDPIGQDFIQTDAPAAHGNSGGPAIGDDASVVGVITAVSLSPGGGAIVQGFNFLIPARDVLTFLHGTDVQPGSGRFSPVWVAGLDAFFRERHAIAAARIAEADRLLPNLVDVRRVLAEAEFKVKNPPPRGSPWPWATAAAVTLASVGFYGGMAGRRWWRNRFRVLPNRIIQFMEAGVNPLLLDVRTETDYETSPLKLPGAIRLDPAGPLNLAAEPGQLIVAYCTSRDEQTSATVVARLRQKGYTNIRILKGGLGGWTNARLPVEAKSSLPSIGLELYKNLSLGDVERRTFKAGERIFHEGGNPHGEAYVIHSGRVEVRRRFEGGERVVATLGDGELLGDMALFRTSASRSAAAVAQSDVELLVIKAERLDWLIHNRPQLTKELLRRLSEMVVATDIDRGRQPPPEN
jgi:rhodanese-related sulfurtransferase